MPKSSPGAALTEHCPVLTMLGPKSALGTEFHPILANIALDATEVVANSTASARCLARSRAKFGQVVCTGVATSGMGTLGAAMWSICQS